MNASRPKVEGEKDAIKERRRPSWMPPPIAFPIIWTTIAVLRAVSSVVVFSTTGTLNNPAHFAMLLHLAVGDTWNSINNAEKRLGTAVVGVCAVLASVYNVVYQYWSVTPNGGSSHRAVRGVDHRGDGAGVHDMEDQPARGRHQGAALADEAGEGVRAPGAGRREARR